jgi:8-oxo-dGTP pyrophosphatase MutT (NUDIX family)
MRRLPDFARCVIKNDSGEILLVFMAKFGKWNFPGGKIDANENPLNTVIREVKEEVNLDIKNPSLIHCGDMVYQGGFIAKGYFYSAEADLASMKIMETEKLTDAKFMSVEEIKKLPKNTTENQTLMILGMIND